MKIIKKMSLMALLVSLVFLASCGTRQTQQKLKQNEAVAWLHLQFKD